MSQNEINLLQLQLNLSQFGLNPTDWILRPTSPSTYLISHKVDLDFKFKGRSKKRKLQAFWKDLNLFSI